MIHLRVTADGYQIDTIAGPAGSCKQLSSDGDSHYECYVQKGALKGKEREWRRKKCSKLI